MWRRSGRRAFPAWRTETINFHGRCFQNRSPQVAELLARDSRLVRRLRLRAVSPRFRYQDCFVFCRLDGRAVLRRSTEPTLRAPQPLLLILFFACFDCGPRLKSRQSLSPPLLFFTEAAMAIDQDKLHE